MTAPTVVHTAYSTYEFDTANKRVRRIVGVNAPTANQGEDGQWKEYEWVGPYFDGGLIIKWVNTTKATITSPVTSIEGTDFTVKEETA